MFLSEPPPTQFDLHFRVAGFPVRIHPLFWVMAVLMGARIRDPVLLLIWLGVVFVSILVHELGHALTMRAFGQSPRIVLHALGGLAIAEASPWGLGRRLRWRSGQQQILISVAGPGAGFVLAGVVVGVVFAAGGAVRFQLASGWLPDWDVTLPKAAAPPWGALVHFLFDVNIFWGLINLLPVLPLDGGQIARELYAQRDPYRGTERALWLSVVAGAVAAVIGAASPGGWYMAILFGWLALTNYLTLQQLGGGRW